MVEPSATRSMLESATPDAEFLIMSLDDGPKRFAVTQAEGLSEQSERSGD